MLLNLTEEWYPCCRKHEHIFNDTPNERKCKKKKEKEKTRKQIQIKENALEVLVPKTK